MHVANNRMYVWHNQLYAKPMQHMYLDQEPINYGVAISSYS